MATPAMAMAGVIKTSWMRKRRRATPLYHASIRGKNVPWKERWFELSAKEICYYDKCVMITFNFFSLFFLSFLGLDAIPS